MYYTKSLKRSTAVGDFYGTEIKIWAGFGSVGITEKKLGQLKLFFFIKNQKDFL